jgi:hypothetical protein
MRPWPIRRVTLAALSVLVGGCGGLKDQPSATNPQPAPRTPWPSAGDYQTIRIARAARDEALFRERDWRRKAYAASLAARTLLTVHMAAGRCAEYVTELYGNLRDLMDAYPGEDWSPLVRLVRREPSFARACHRPHPYPHASRPAGPRPPTSSGKAAS